MQALQAVFLVFLVVLIVYGTHRFLALRMLGLDVFGKIAIFLLAGCLLYTIRSFPKVFIKDNIFLLLCLFGSLIAGYIGGVVTYGLVLVIAFLIYSTSRSAIELSVVVLSLLGILFSFLSWILFILMINYSGDLSFCDFYYNERLDQSNLDLKNIFGICHPESREYFGLTLFRQRSFSSEPARMIGYILFPIALGAIQSKYIWLRKFCVNYFPFAAIPSLSVNVLFVVVPYVIMRFLPFRRSMYFYVIFIAIPVASILFFTFFDHALSSELIRSSDINKDLNIFHGSTTRRFEYFHESLSLIAEALPFGGIIDIAGNLPVTLILNLGLFGAAAYLMLVVRLKQIFLSNIGHSNGQLALMACFFPILAINASGHFLAPGTLLMIILIGRLIDYQKRI